MNKNDNIVSFRKLVPTYYPLLLKWLQTSHVKEWWNDGDDTLEKVAWRYRPDDKGAGYLILLDERPIGYIQYELFTDGGAGVDLFIGEANQINKGIGTQTMKEFVEQVVELHQPTFVDVDPHPDNKRAIRCYEKAGFKHVLTIVTTEGKLSYLMRRNSPYRS
jgi:RimJ/RimL family protein N-acetyltransferase